MRPLLLLALAVAIFAGCANEPAPSDELPALDLDDIFMTEDGHITVKFVTETKAEVTTGSVTDLCTYRLTDGTLELRWPPGQRRTVAFLDRVPEGFREQRGRGMTLYSSAELERLSEERAARPKDDMTLIQEATERFVVACLAGDMEAIFKNVYPAGAYGWVNRRHDLPNRRRYRLWKNLDTPEEIEKAKQFRIEQDVLMYNELVALPRELALTDTETIRGIVATSKPRIVLAEATVVLRNGGGEVMVTLGPGETSTWIVQDWHVERSASGTPRSAK